MAATIAREQGPTSSTAAARQRDGAVPVASTAIAGLLLVGAGALFLMGIITAEALYDAVLHDARQRDQRSRRDPAAG